jgi:hypothetical protein
MEAPTPDLSALRPHPTTTEATSKRTSRWLRLLALAGLVLGALLLFLGAVKPRIETWGSTAGERNAVWPGDELVPSPAFVWTNAITIDRPAAAVWPWLTQWGQGRGGLYSYDWLENLVGCGIDSATRVLPRFQRPLLVGDQAIRMCRYAPPNPVARVDQERALVLGAVSDSPADVRAARVSSTWAWILDPIDADTTRLIVRTRDSSPSTRVQGPIQFVMQRQTMRGIEHRAEGTAVPLADVVEPALWLISAAVFLIASVRVFIQRTRWWQPLLVAALALISWGWLMFWQPPFALGVAITGFSIGLLSWSIVVGRRRPQAGRALALPEGSLVPSPPPEKSFIRAG